MKGQKHIAKSGGEWVVDAMVQHMKLCSECLHHLLGHQGSGSPSRNSLWDCRSSLSCHSHERLQLLFIPGFILTKPRLPWQFVEWIRGLDSSFFSLSLLPFLPFSLFFLFKQNESWKILLWGATQKWKEDFRADETECYSCCLCAPPTPAVIIEHLQRIFDMLLCSLADEYI